jgi:hypothetical protein
MSDTKALVYISLNYTPTTKYGGCYNGFALSCQSVRWSVIRPSPFSCPLYYSYTNWRIFFKLGSNVHLNKGMCRTHFAHVSGQGQGHNWRSNIKHNQILDSMSCPLCQSYTNWKIFFNLGLNVHFNKGICRTHVAYVSAQGQGHNWRSNI